MTKYSYYLLLSCLMFLAGCQTVEPLAIDYMLPADVSFPPSLKRVAIVNNMPEVPDNKPILAQEKKKDDFEIASKTDYYNGAMPPLPRNPLPKPLPTRTTSTKWLSAIRPYVPTMSLPAKERCHKKKQTGWCMTWT